MTALYKTCPFCNEVKSIDHFYKSISPILKNITYQSLCKNCISFKQSCKKKNITTDQYNEYLNKQNNVCAICKTKTDRLLSIDHNHKNGKIRGLLCINCNSGIGFFEDNIDFLKQAIKYLEMYKNEL